MCHGNRGFDLKIRDATVEDSKNIADSQLEFSISEGIKREDIIYEKGLSHIKNNFFRDLSFGKIIVSNENKIMGGLFMALDSHYYNNDWIASDEMFFTSPSIRPYTRLKIAITLIKEAMEWAFDKRVKYFRINMQFKIRQ